MNLSYWEYKTWLSHIDFTIVGSGIVGLNCALHLKNKYPKAKIVILERGFLPQGASTKNAGFACFGSISEIISDLDSHSGEEVVQLVSKRWEGIQLLRRNLGDAHIGFQAHGGYELFPRESTSLYQKCADRLDAVNALLKPIFKENPFHITENAFGFRNVLPTYVAHRFEGQVDTGKMMEALLHKAQRAGIVILNSISVNQFVDKGQGVEVSTDRFDFNTGNLLIATNGFASQLLGEDVQPARAQVLITKPIKDLHIKGTFHMDQGFYYFRDIEGRILLGGGRNLDFEGERTTEFGETELIQARLEKILHEVILPETEYEIDRRWSGIMGVGNQKRPILKQISNKVYCGVRMGGMGIAIGSVVGTELAELAF